MLLKLFFDAVLINFSFVLAYYFRFKILVFITPGSAPIFEHYSNILIFITIVWLAIFKMVGVYDERKVVSLLDELAALFWGVLVSALVLVGLLFLYRELWFSRLVVVNAWWIAFLLLGWERLLLIQFGNLMRKRGVGIKNVLILGAGEMGQALVLKVINDKNSGYKMLGFLDDDPLHMGKTYHQIPVLGEVNISKIQEIIREKKIGEIIVASSQMPSDKILDIVTECEKYGVEFKIVPGILELIATRLDIDEVGGIPLLTISEIQLQGINAFIKRTADIFLSFIGIVILSPFLLLVALLVKATSEGPVFFRQERVGMEGKTFLMFKFRSMRQDAEMLFSSVAALSEVEGHIFKMKDDPRVTPLGKFMRRYSIDELPQLFNVFLGQMSMVGPRPPLPREVEKYNPWHKKRLRVRPGITGPWQVSGRSLLPFEDMVRLDIYYIENWSLWLDFKILLQTFPVVVFGTGAF